MYSEKIKGDSINEVSDHRSEPDFHETLRGKDAAISKFDKTEVSSKPSGPVSIQGQAKAHCPLIMLGAVGCVVSEDEEMSLMNSPPGIEYKSRGWKSIVQDRPHTEIQTMPMQRKRVLRDEVNEYKLKTPWKKPCATDTTQIETVEAAG